MKTRKPHSSRRPQGGKPTAKSGRYKAQGSPSRSGRSAGGHSAGEGDATPRAKRTGRPGIKKTDGRAENSGAQSRPGRKPRTAAGSRASSRSKTLAAKHIQPAELTETMRIAKAMARSGLCSRRDAERWIEAGRVAVNGKTLETPATDVGPGDKILIDGHSLPATEPSRIWRYHKPKGLLTTHRNDQKYTADGKLEPDNRKTVFETLPRDMPRVISVGRLDYNTEGLLLLTNDGALARYLELPATGWLRRYRVRVNGAITQEKLDTLADGITIERVRYSAITATLDSTQGANTWLTVAIREGKNREIRKIMEHLGLTVNRLIRISFGPFQLLDLKPGNVEPVKRRVLREQLSRKVADELGLLADIEEDGNTAPSAEPSGRVANRKVPTGKAHTKWSTSKKAPAKKAGARRTGSKTSDGGKSGAGKYSRGTSSDGTKSKSFTGGKAKSRTRSSNFKRGGRT